MTTTHPVACPDLPRSAVTDQNIEDMIGAAEFGITYWAQRPSAEFIAAHPDAICYLADDEDAYALTAEQIREAYFALLDLQQPWVNSTIHGNFLSSWQHRSTEEGIDAGDIDSDAGDCLLQVAAFGKVIYG